MTAELLGRREGQTTEFKAAGVLDRPERVAREVVGMLNAGGGDIWIGVREEHGVATGEEGVPEPEAGRRSLADYLQDTLEPAPLPGEVEIEVEDRLLHVRVKPHGDRTPYAHLDKGRRLYVVRVGDRLRHLSREEIAERFSEAHDGGETEIAETDDKLREEQDRRAKRASENNEKVIWLRVQPCRPGRLSFDRLLATDLLTDPAATGNRRAGSHFAQFAYPSPPPQVVGGATGLGRPGQVAFGRGALGSLGLWVFDDGAVLFEVALAGVSELQGSPVRSHVGGPVFYSLALLEYPISVFRLVAELLRRTALWDEPPGDKTVARWALLGLEGWALLPGSPSAWQHRWRLASRFEEPDFFAERGLVFDRRELVTEPDRCGFRLVRELYSAFGFLDRDMPPEFDQRSGRLILPE